MITGRKNDILLCVTILGGEVWKSFEGGGARCITYATSYVNHDALDAANNDLSCIPLPPPPLSPPPR